MFRINFLILDAIQSRSRIGRNVLRVLATETENKLTRFVTNVGKMVADLAYIIIMILIDAIPRCIQRLDGCFFLYEFDILFQQTKMLIVLEKKQQNCDWTLKRLRLKDIMSSNEVIDWPLRDKSSLRSTMFPPSSNTTILDHYKWRNYCR